MSIKELKESLEKEKKQKEEYLGDLKRVQAEFENYKKRQEKENCNYKEYSEAVLIGKLLPFLDDFECSVNVIDKCKTDEIKQGFQLLLKNIKQIMEKEGVREIEALNKKFDPFRHEILQKEKSDKEEGIILEVFQKGYMFKDKVLRHAKVKVSEGGKNE